jgi:ATP-binding cassette subfamily A (ABC1) protein 3
LLVSHSYEILCHNYYHQFDALLELLTGRELLTLFARLRGVPEKQIKEVVEVEINRLDLKKHANKRCSKYRLVNVINAI